MKKIVLLVFFVLAAGLARQALAARPLVTNSLIKCPDYSSVYYLTDDDERWVFPDETTYFSWYMDFKDVIEVSCEELATYPIGGVVTFQPGTKLLTTPSTNDVYAVEPGGVLRLIESETDAITLYGDLWWTHVRDTSEAFWPYYEMGAPLETGEMSEGSILFIPDIDLSNNHGWNYYYYDGDQIRLANDYVDANYGGWSVSAYDESNIDELEMGDEMDDETWEVIKTPSHRPEMCEYEGVMYQLGDNWDISCGNTCGCSESGWACTEIGCAE